MDAQIKLRGDTAANWTSENPVLADREIGIEKGTPIKIKIGDGTTAWNSLAYFGGAGTVETDTSLIGDGSSGDLLSVSGFETHVTAAGITTLTDASAPTQMFTGTNVETIYMPPAADIKIGREYWIINRSSGDITLQSAGGGGGSALNIVKTNGICVLRLIANSGAGSIAWHAITTYTFAGVTPGDMSAHIASYGGGAHDIPTPTAANDFQVGNGVSGVGARWIKKTLAEVKTILGLGSAAYTASTDYQPVDTDLTAIAGLTPSDDDIIQRKSGAWVVRTVAQYLADMVLTGVSFATSTAVVATDAVRDAIGKIQAQINNLNGGWVADASTWTFYNRTQAFTNDPAAGANITLNMTDTTGFVVGRNVNVSSGTGNENTYITAVVANTSITVNNLYLNHNTTSRVVTLLNVFTISGDVTATLKAKARIKWTQTTVKYGVVETSTYVAPNTEISVVLNTDYTVTNAAISANYYSYLDNPSGFPTWFSYDPAPLGWSTVPTVGAGDAEYYYRLEGSGGWVTISQGNSAGTSNATTMTFSAPVTCNKVTAVVMPTTYDNNTLKTTAPGKAFANGGNVKTMTCRSDLGTGAWTNTNGKRVIFTLPISW